MDNQFLSEITTAYLVDNNKQRNRHDELYSYIIEVRDSIKKYNRPLYEDLSNDTTLYQQKIIYRLFDTYNIVNSEEIKEDAGLISGPIAIGLIIAAVGSFLLGTYQDRVLASIWKSVWDKLSWLRKIVFENKRVKEVDEKIKQHDVILSMLDEEYSNCAKKCGIDPKAKTTFWQRMTRDKSESDRYTNMSTLSGEDCAVTCTLDYLTSSFAELNKVYKSCLQKTGEDLNSTDDTDTAIFSLPTGTGCQEIRDELDQIYKNFKKMIDIIFKEDPQVKSMWINIMNQKVKTALSGKSVKHYSPRNIQFDLRSQYTTSQFK
jgi:hypothetical protein